MLYNVCMPDEKSSNYQQPTPHQMPPSIGTGEGEVPLATISSQNTTIRTMASDKESLKATGGTGPQAYSPTPQADARTTIKPPADFPQPQKIQQKEIFTPSQVTPPTPPQVFSTTSETTPPPDAQNTRVSKILLMLLLFLVIAALALAGYYFVYPAMTKDRPTLPEGESASSPSKKPAIPEIPLVTEQASSSPTETPSSVSTSTQNSSKSPSKQSLFRISSDSTTQAELKTADLSSYNSLLGTQASQTPSFKEIVVTQAGTTTTFPELMSLLLPNVFAADLLQAFESYSIFTYSDQLGTWPGYAVKLASGQSVSSRAAEFQVQIESSAPETIARLYPISPGAGQTWKQGKTGDILNRYLVYSKDNFAISLNYGWVNNVLIISTSYDGFKEALRRIR